MVTLTCEPRGLTKSARNDARRRGCIPAVVYGKGMEPTPIMVDAVAFRDAMKTGARNQLIRLEGLDRPHTVLIKEVQEDRAYRDLVHIDFFEPADGKKVRIRVPVVFRGEEALTKRGLIMTYQIHEVEVECDPSSVPAYLSCDVGAREPGDAIKVGDLRVPPNVRCCVEPDTVVLNIDVPMTTMVHEVPANVTTSG